MNGGATLLLLLGSSLAFRLLFAWVRDRKRVVIEEAIAASAALAATPIRFEGRRKDCQRAEAIAEAHGWKKVEEGRWQIFWRTVRFVPSNEDASPPQEVLKAFDSPIKIKSIKLPSLTTSKEA